MSSSTIVQARDQISEAKVARSSLITSGATVSQKSPCQRARQAGLAFIRTPIRRACGICILNGIVDCIQLKRDAKVRQLDVAVLGSEKVGSLEIAVDNMHAVQIAETFQDLHDVASD